MSNNNINNEYELLTNEKRQKQNEYMNSGQKFVASLRKYYFKCLQKEDGKLIKNLKLIGKCYSSSDEDDYEQFDDTFLGVIEFQRLTDGAVLHLIVDEQRGLLIGGNNNIVKSVFDNYICEKFPDFDKLKEEFLSIDLSENIDKHIDKETGINKSIKFIRNRIEDLEKNGSFDHLSMQNLNDVFSSYFEVLKECYPETLYGITYDDNEFVIEMKHKIKTDDVFLKNFKFYWNEETKRVEAWIGNFVDGMYFSDRIPNTLELIDWIHEMDKII